MSRVKCIIDVVNDLRSLADSIEALVRSLEASQSGKNKSTEDKLPTLGEVRMKLAALAQDGKQAEVKALITEFGARKLSDIPADRYPELLEKASEI